MFADRLSSIEGSPTLALSAKAKALKQSGKPVVNFTAGEPDFSTPDFIKEAAIKAIHDNQTRYTAVAGIPELRQIVAENLNGKHAAKYKAENVLVSCGAKHVLYNIFQALCQAGDEVILFDPYWVSYTQMVHLSGATPKVLHTSEAEGFLPDIDRLKAAISDKTKVILLNSPSNPTGAVIDRERLTAIATLALEKDIWVVSDEIYDELVYKPNTHASIIGCVPEIIDKAFLVNGVSKTYSMTGWRIGFAAGPKPVIDAMTKIQSHSTSNPTSISQFAAMAALTGDQAPVRKMLEAFEERRDAIVGGLNQIEGVHCPVPAGAFYAWAQFKHESMRSAELAARLLEDTYVAMVPSEGFGVEGWMRLSFAVSLETIHQGIERIATWKTEQA